MTHEHDTAPQRRRTERESQVNLAVVLRLCDEGKVRCSEATRRPSAAAVQTIARHLLDGDFYSDEPIAAFAWPLLLQAGGLARIEGGRLRLTAKGRAALRKPTAEVVRQLWERWLSHAVIDEFSRVEHIKGQRSANVLSAAGNRRRLVAEALKACPVGEWIGVDALFAAMRRAGLHPTVARNERALWKLYLVDAQYGSLGYEGFDRWEIVAGRYALAVLFEYAATLGLIDVEYVHPAGARDDFRDNWGADELDFLSRYDGLQALRLNDLGAYALGLTGDYAPSEATDVSAALSVLPSMQVVVEGTLAPQDEMLLSTWCTRVSGGVWSIDEARLLDAVAAGHQPDEFASFLARRSTGEVPAPVRVLLKAVSSRAGLLTDHGLFRIVECADPALADLLWQERTVAARCRRLNDRQLAVPIEHEGKVRDAVRRLGYVLPDARPS